MSESVGMMDFMFTECPAAHEVKIESEMGREDVQEGQGGTPASNAGGASLLEGPADAQSMHTMADASLRATAAGESEKAMKLHRTKSRYVCGAAVPLWTCLRRLRHC